MAGAPDIFAPIHKGLRKALFDLCVRLGRIDLQDEVAFTPLSQHAMDVVRYVDHHTFAENTLLLPLLEQRAPMYFDRMTKSHGDLEALRDKMHAAAQADGPTLYHTACEYTAAHLEHMREEEQLHLPVIHIHLSPDELSDFEKNAAALLPDEDRQAMAAFMIAAVNDAELDALLERLKAMLPAESFAAVRHNVEKLRAGT